MPFEKEIKIVYIYTKHYDKFVVQTIAREFEAMTI